MSYKEKRIIAVVPARSGSKGIPDKNIKKIRGVSLLARAAKTLIALKWIDKAIVSTDSEKYAEEAREAGLDAPFLRPDYLSSDSAGAVETIQHAVNFCEQEEQCKYDIVLIIEPSSPLRTIDDIRNCVDLLIESCASSVVAVSPIDTKFHPEKILVSKNGCLDYFSSKGGAVKSRQQLSANYYFRNGICYAINRDVIMEQAQIINSNSRSYIVNRPVVNLDEPIEIEWLDFLLSNHYIEDPLTNLKDDTTC